MASLVWMRYQVLEFAMEWLYRQGVLMVPIFDAPRDVALLPSI